VLARHRFARAHRSRLLTFSGGRRMLVVKAKIEELLKEEK
jgi:hypothetical protein